MERRESAGMVNIAMSLFASILGCGWKPHLWCIIVIFLHLLEKRSRLSFSPIIPSLHACARALARLRACFLESASLWWKLWRINQPRDLASIKEVEEPLATLIKTTKSISISDCPCLCCHTSLQTRDTSLQTHLEGCKYPKLVLKRCNHVLHSSKKITLTSPGLCLQTPSHKLLNHSLTVIARLDVPAIDMNSRWQSMILVIFCLPALSQVINQLTLQRTQHETFSRWKPNSPANNLEENEEHFPWYMDNQ